MISVRGTFRDGSAQPSERIEGREGEPVIITFLDESVSKEFLLGNQEKREPRTKERELWDRLFTRKLAIGSHPTTFNPTELSGDDLLF